MASPDGVNPFVARSAPFAPPPPGKNITFVEIGCGQGEVVNSLQSLGATCAGFDPTLRSPGSGLYRSLFHAGTTKLEFPPDIFIMRCVLPHVQNPDGFLHEIFWSYPSALVFVEFQDLEVTLETGAFWQISHDHVNYFRKEWFERHFSLIDSGTLSEEWAWVLIGNRSQAPHGNLFPQPGKEIFDCKLERAKQSVLKWFASVQPAVIIGAGGKGANLSFQLVQENMEIAVVDLDDRKQFRFLEGSGLEVLPYSWLENGGQSFRKVLLNPYYKDEVANLLGSTDFEILGTMRSSQS